MTPIDPNELRRELMSVDPGHGTRPGDLGTQVIQRGRAVKRQRTAVAAFAAFALVAGGFGLAQVLPLGGRDAVPAVPVVSTTAADPTPTPTTEPVPTTMGPVPTTTPEPTPSVDPTTAPPEPLVSPTVIATEPGEGQSPVTDPPVPDPIWTDTAFIPGEVGDVGGLTLLHDGEPTIEGETSGWQPRQLIGTGCSALEHFDLQSLLQLEGSRHIEVTGPEYSNAEGVLVFRSEAGAIQFMDEYRTSVAQCVAMEPEVMPEGAGAYDSRVVLTSHELNGVAQEAFTFGSHSQWEMDPGVWTDTPGGWFSVLARQGDTVILVEAAGEYVGDIVQSRGDVVEEVRLPIDHVLQQF